MPSVTGLWLYPLKSGRGVAVESLCAGPRGVAGDRRWMVVDTTQRFLTQRQLPGMACIEAVSDESGLRLAVEGQGSLEVAVPPWGGSVRRVHIWGQDVDALSAGDAAAAWLTDLLGRPCELVYLAPQMDRALPPGYSRHEGEVVGFADAFHALLIGDGTLAELNAHLENKGLAPVPLDRFRPNIAVSGLAAGEEDGWRRIAIGEVRFRVAKPCERCLVTTVNQQTGERNRDGEPLRTLQEYRLNSAGNALFGQNLVAESAGIIRFGDLVRRLV